MKLSIITSALSMAASVAAGSFFQQQSLGIEFDIGASGIEKVPGENPLYYCGDTSRDIASIETVDLSPNPPLPYVSPSFASLNTLLLLPLPLLMLNPLHLPVLISPTSVAVWLIRAQWPDFEHQRGRNPQG